MSSGIHFFKARFTFVLLILLFSCKSDKNHSNLLENILLPSEKTKQFEFIKDDQLKIEIISVSDEVHAEIGGHISDFIYSDSTYVLVKRYPPKIVAINQTGEMLWNIQPDSDFRTFDAIGSLHFNSQDSFFEVFDLQNLITFRYDFEGRYLQQKKEEFTYNAKVKVGDSCTIVDVIYSNIGIDKPEFQNARLYLDCINKEIKPLFYEPELNETAIHYQDYFAFFKSTNEIFYHPDFSDTIYRYEKTFQKAKVIQLVPDRERREILTNGSLASKYQELLNTQTPFINKVGMVGDLFFGVYVWKGGYYNFAFDFKSGENIKMAKHLVVNGTPLRSPFLVRDNIILTQMPDYEFDFLSGLKLSEMTENLAVEEKMEQARGNIEGGMVYIILSGR